MNCIVRRIPCVNDHREARKNGEAQGELGSTRRERRRGARAKPGFSASERGGRSFSRSTRHERARSARAKPDSLGERASGPNFVQKHSARARARRESQIWHSWPTSHWPNFIQNASAQARRAKRAKSRSLLTASCENSTISLSAVLSRPPSPHGSARRTGPTAPDARTRARGYAAKDG